MIPPSCPSLCLFSHYLFHKLLKYPSSVFFHCSDSEVLQPEVLVVLDFTPCLLPSLSPCLLSPHVCYGCCHPLYPLFVIFPCIPCLLSSHVPQAYCLPLYPKPVVFPCTPSLLSSPVPKPVVLPCTTCLLSSPIPHAYKLHNPETLVQGWHHPLWAGPCSIN